MNEDFTSLNPDENKEGSPETVRKPIRRARRTVAPFIEKSALDVSEETKAEEVTVSEEILNQEVVEAAAEIRVSPEKLDENDSESFAEEAENEDVSDETEFRELTEAEKDKEPTSETETEEVEETAETESEEVEETEEAKEPEEKLSPVAETFDWIKSFLLSLAAVIFIFTLIFRGVTVNGGSMLPTLENQEYLIISDLLYTPKTGDIVVVQSPHYKNATEPLIKRIIATGGQTVKINFATWEVWVDGELLHEDYILRDGATSMNCEDMKPDENFEVEFKVEENCIFVMGDHRNDSLDSRSNSVGQIDERYIMGRVLLRLTPIDRFGKVA